MKKVLTVAAAAGLMMLAACTPSATNNTAEDALNGSEANVDVYEDSANIAVDNTVLPVENVAEGNAL